MSSYWTAAVTEFQMTSEIPGARYGDERALT